MKGDKILNILETIGEGAAYFSDVMLIALTTAKSQQSSIPYRARLLKRERRWDRLERQKKQRFYNLLYKLRKEGLVEVDPLERKLNLTAAGLEKLSKLKLMIFRKPNHVPEPDSNVNIVAFDVPEKYKAKRNWLREVIRGLGFKMLQKSVWIGKIKIPKEFLEELGRLKLIDYVEILAITGSGTVREIN